MSTNISRRNLIAGAAIAGSSLACVAGKALADAPEVEWADEADVVILGMGVAGMTAACTICMEGLGSCLVLEAAPYDLRGGNSSATGGVVFCPNSVDAAIEYQTALNQGYEVPQDVMQTWAEEICQNVAWLDENFDTKLEGNYFDECGEFPFMARADECPSYSCGNGTTWGCIAAKYDELGVKTCYEARGVELITGAEGEVTGVKVEDGRCFKANKGVLLACGGFEHNKEMLAMYNPTGCNNMVGKGSWYNRGDGILMAQRLGAKLWHMNNMSGCNLGTRCLVSDEVDARTMFVFKTKQYIYVDGRCQRFIDEDLSFDHNIRHGKVYSNGAQIDFPHPTVCWAIFTQGEVDAGGAMPSGTCFARKKPVEGVVTNAQEAIEAGLYVRCDTHEEIAQVLGVDVSLVDGTLDYYNQCAEANDDPLFNRGKAINEFCELISQPGHEDDFVAREAFDLEKLVPPFYVARVYACMYNTQGGPVRSADCEVLDIDGNPIPRLYEAGEMGCEYPYVYNVGGNISGAVSSGRRAARVICGLDPVA